MSDPLKIEIIVGSVRKECASLPIARWVHAAAQAHQRLEAELVDLAAWGLPIFSLAAPPAMGVYTDPLQRRWAAKIGAADGYILVAPEYNHGPSAVLKNALDYLYTEWNRKPVAFVSFGNAGGARAVEQLRGVAVELKMAPLGEAVHLFGLGERLKAGTFEANAKEEQPLARLFESLAWWGDALRTARRADAMAPQGAQSVATTAPAEVQGRKVLVIGLSPEVNRSVVNPLKARGIAAQGWTQADEADRRFNAEDFELIVFGRGVLGPVADRLKRAFAKQNPGIRFVDAIHPIAVDQTLAALAHDPTTPRFIEDFQVTREAGCVRASAEILAPSCLKLTLYRRSDGDVAPETLSEAMAEPGHFESKIDAEQLRDANSLVLSVEGQEYHLHPFLT